ncbi:hypothetical protein EVAR_39801_1, partial [Eumeta japonica]
TCYRCCEVDHRIMSCPQSRGESFQMYKPSSAATAVLPQGFPKKRPVASRGMSPASA